MTQRSSLVVMVAIVAVAVVVLASSRAEAGGKMPSYKVLAPIVHGNLTIFPVVANAMHNTGEFITLDEGLKSGQVIVTEGGRIPPMIRRHITMPRGGDEVNRLVLVNESDKPLILLAGEVVTGGKQDRVIGKDRIVPAKSDPVDLSVFCVEPGRWTERSAKFGGLSMQMAAPSIRSEAMAAKNQAQVWDKVRESNAKMAAAAPRASGQIASTTSYAMVQDNEEVKRKIDEVAQPVQRSYQNVIGELRDRNAVGVVVAVDGRIIWADLFASTSLLQKYWPKLVRSYAAEAVSAGGDSSKISVGTAEDFLSKLEGEHEVVETEPGVYRHAEISGSNFRVFELMSLLPNTGFDVHVAKMAGSPLSAAPIGMRR